MISNDKLRDNRLQIDIGNTFTAIEDNWRVFVFLVPCKGDRIQLYSGQASNYQELMNRLNKFLEEECSEK